MSTRSGGKERARWGRAPKRGVAAAGGLAIFAAVGPVADAGANQFTVLNLNDTGMGSLRGALSSANGDSEKDRIVFRAGLTGTLTLTTGSLPVDESTDIVGPGPSVVKIDGNGDRILDIGTDTATRVGISGLTLMNGSSPGDGGAIRAFGADLTLANDVLSGNVAGDEGGAVWTDGDVDLQSTTLTGNSAGDEGGGISAKYRTTVTNSTISLNVAGTTVANGSGGGISTERLAMQGSTVSGNSVQSNGSGGGLYVGGRGSIAGSTLIGNTASRHGGALNHGSGPFTISTSTMSGNVAGPGDALGGYGGAIFTTSGKFTVGASTITGNTAGEDGGAIYSNNSASPGSLQIDSSTIAGNSTGLVNTGDSGGAIWFCCGDGLEGITIRDSTISGNSTPGSGGGIYSTIDPDANPQALITNSIVANNTAGILGPDLFTDPFDMVSRFDVAFSLIENPATARINQIVPGSNILNTDPALQPLALNGGPTRTMGLLASSPAVDKGSAAAVTDQRGAARPVDRTDAGNSGAPGADGADIGAFELEALQVPPPKCRGLDATIVASGPVISGTAGRDVILGSPGVDRINAGGGNDVICGLAGNDILSAGAGNDKTYGAAGNDRQNGGAGVDILDGSAGKDKLIGGRASDILKGGPGNDTLYGGPGRDKLSGGNGKDKLMGGPGKDRIRGGPGSDREKQ